MYDMKRRMIRYDALERFKNPAKYLVEVEGSAWHVVDEETIMYKTVSKEDAIVLISSSREGKYKIVVQKAGEISAMTWPEISNMHTKLQEESKYYNKIKRAVLAVPKPDFIELLYNDETETLRVFDDDDELVVTINKFGSADISKYEMHESVKNYVHALVIQMMYV